MDVLWREWQCVGEHSNCTASLSLIRKQTSASSHRSKFLIHQSSKCFPFESSSFLQDFTPVQSKIFDQGCLLVFFFFFCFWFNSFIDKGIIKKKKRDILPFLFKFLSRALSQVFFFFFWVPPVCKPGLWWRIFSFFFTNTSSIKFCSSALVKGVPSAWLMSIQELISFSSPSVSFVGQPLGSFLPTLHHCWRLDKGIRPHLLWGSGDVILVFLDLLQCFCDSFFFFKVEHLFQVFCAGDFFVFVLFFEFLFCASACLFILKFNEQSLHKKGAQIFLIFFFEENFLLSFFPSNFWWEFERVLFLKSEFYLIFLNHKWHFFLHQVFFQEYDKHMLPTPPIPLGFFYSQGEKKGDQKKSDKEIPWFFKVRSKS